MKILAYLPHMADATSFYRGKGALDEMERDHPDVRVQYVDVMQQGWDTMNWADIVFIQRPSYVHFKSVIHRASMMDKPLWIDFDDNLWNIPDYLQEMMENRVDEETLALALDSADLITVSTKEIQKSIMLATDNGQIEVVPNALPDWMYSAAMNMKDISFARMVQTSRKEPPCVLWRGAEGYVHKDLDQFEDMYKEIIRSGIKFVAMGNKAPYMEEAEVIPWQHDFLEYLRLLREARPTHLVKILLDNTFNRSRSNVAMMEAAYAGALTIAPNWDEWNGAVQYLEGELNVDFEQTLLHLISDTRKWPEQMAEQARHVRRLKYENERRYNLLNALLVDRKLLSV